MRDAEAKRMMLSVASSYEELAQRAETRRAGCQPELQRRLAKTTSTSATQVRGRRWISWSKTGRLVRRLPLPLIRMRRAEANRIKGRRGGTHWGVCAAPRCFLAMPGGFHLRTG